MSNTIALALQCGADFWAQFVYTDAAGNPVNITSPKMEVRSGPNSTSALLYTSEQAPAAPALTLGTTGASGGVATAGTYFWKVTAVGPTGETLGSNEVTATLVANGTQALSWTAVANATGYNVYRATTAGGETGASSLVAKLGNLTAYTDLGAATTAGAVPTTAPAATITFTQPAANSVLFRIAGAVTKNQTAVVNGYFDAYATDPNGYEVELGSGSFTSTPNVTAL